MNSLVLVAGHLSKRKAESNVELVNEMLNSFRSSGCNMNIQVHYLNTPLKLLIDTSEEQDERFHHDIKTLKMECADDDKLLTVLKGNVQNTFKNVTEKKLTKCSVTRLFH